MCNLTIVLYVNGSLEKKSQTNNVFPIYTSLTRLRLYLSLVLFFFLVG